MKIKSLLVSIISVVTLLASPRSIRGATGVPVATNAVATIPFNQIGAVAGKQYSGDGLAIMSTHEGAQLHCVFQRLNGRLTTDGLWLTSTVDGAKGQPFRVIARAVGRSRSGLLPLPLTGKVEVEDHLARFIRPGLIEEYSVSVDGVRQDFVIDRRPEGTGPVRLELEVDGAKAEAITDGAQLLLADGGRKLVYNRLKAVDARGRQLAARLEVLSPRRLAVVLDDSMVQYPLRIDPTFSDADWISLGGMPGANGYVNAAVVDSAGNLYVGGSFTAVGNAYATNIAEWNGSSWSALGEGLGGPVYALAISGTNLYVGGGFASAGGTYAPNVAEWNGSSWAALGTGVLGHVYALAVSGNNLYVGGNFTTAGGISANCIAEWNGSSWSALGTGISGGGWDNLGPQVLTLAVSGNNLYVGGDFYTAGGISANYVAEWNGSSWSALGFGMNSFVYTLAVFNGNLCAGGDFTAAGSVSANYIAEWNGSYWTNSIPGMNSDVETLAVSGNTLYAGGLFTTAGGVSANYIAQWNGSSWSAVDSGMNGAVGAIAVSGNKLYALATYGGFTTAGNASTGNIAEWNGGSWLALRVGLNNYVYALAVSSNTLYVGGYFTTVGGALANSIAQWNGSSWSVLGSGMNGSVAALAVSGTNLFAGGGFTTAGGVAANYIAEWNGSSWSALGSGMNNGVNTLAVSGNNLYAGGYFTTAGGISANHIAQWNGASWSALGAGMGGTDPYVYALAVSSNTLYVGGAFTNVGGISANHIAQWNGTSWSPLGSGMGGIDPYVYALAVSGNRLYAGGVFATAGGISATNIAQWDGSSWSAMGSGMNFEVKALVVSDTYLYAGGAFTTAGGVSANHIAEWGGNSWSSLASGIGGGGVTEVFALAAYSNSSYVGGNFTISNMLYVGGNFTNAGASVAYNLAEALLAGSTFIFTTNNDAITITGYTGAAGAVTIPSTINGYKVTSIGDYAFSGSSLSSVTIPNSITNIGQGVFNACASLTAINVDPDNPAYSSAGGVLFNAAQTTLVAYPGGVNGSYTIPDTVTNIEDYAFSHCTNLSSVTIPNSTINIGDYAFIGCINLTNVTIPNSITSIGLEVFDSCSSLLNVTIPNSVTGVGDYAFDGCSSLTNITIPDSVTSIGDSAFYACVGLSSVTISAGVTNIGIAAFAECDSLTSIMVDPLNANYSSLNGVLFNKNQTTLIQYPIGNSAESYTIPSTVNLIGIGAFEMCNLTNVTISGSVCSIGSSAFFDCLDLGSVTIPGSVTNIGQYAFQCPSLTSVYFMGNAPSSVFPVFIIVIRNGHPVSPTTVYYLPGTSGWSNGFGSVPTVPWTLPYPLILDSANGNTNLGIQNDQFGFTISWATNLSVVVEASTNLANPIWTPVSTDTLNGGTFYFSDPTWMNYPGRFYRISAP